VGVAAGPGLVYAFTYVRRSQIGLAQSTGETPNPASG
jgi:hypothetical protein